MALAVRNAQSATSSGGTSVTVTKPTGLIVGDWLVAYVRTTDATSHTLATPSGWTAKGETGVAAASNNRRYGVFTKVADSSDVAASNFTFSTSGPVADRMIGHLLAIQEVGAFNSIELDSVAASGTSISFTGASTPALTGSLCLLSVTGGDSANLPTVSGYTTTPSATFTEVLDTNIDYGADDIVMAVASATISGTSEITAYGATLSSSVDNKAGSLLLFTPIVNATGTNALHEASPTFFTPSGSAGTTGTNALHTASPEFFDQSGRATAPTQWTNNAKNSTTWTNEDKSS